MDDFRSIQVLLSHCVIVDTSSTNVHSLLTYNFPLTPSLLLPKNLRGTSTSLARRNSATFFPRKSTVLVQLTPRSKWSWSRKWTARIFGNSTRSCRCKDGQLQLELE